jgi:hypothetical protein
MYEVMITVPALPGERNLNGFIKGIVVLRTRSKRRALRVVGLLNRLTPVLLSWPDCRWQEWPTGAYASVCN